MPPKRATVKQEDTPFRITREIPEGQSSAYANHVTVQRRALPDGAEEVTITFWQVPAYRMEVEQRKATAVFLGSYVMSGPFALSVMGLLAGRSSDSSAQEGVGE